MVIGFAIIIAMGILFYILYINGYLIINAKKAVMFVGTIRGNRGCKANFTSCAGTIKRIIRFKESKTYHFDLISQLSKGELLVEILDSAKQPILRLDGNNQSADINVNAKQRYYMVFSFHSATGKYELSWG